MSQTLFLIILNRLFCKATSLAEFIDKHIIASTGMISSPPRGQSIAFSKIFLIGQGVYDMECHLRIFFVHKYFRDILRFYTQRSDPCLIERITPIDIFRFTIELDSRSRQRIRNAIALVRIRNCCDLRFKNCLLYTSDAADD